MFSSLPLSDVISAQTDATFLPPPGSTGQHQPCSSFIIGLQQLFFSTTTSVWTPGGFGVHRYQYHNHLLFLIQNKDFELFKYMQLQYIMQYTMVNSNS